MDREKVRRVLEFVIVAAVITLSAIGLFNGYIESRDWVLATGIAVALFEGTDIADILRRWLNERFNQGIPRRNNHRYSFSW